MNIPIEQNSTLLPAEALSPIEHHRISAIYPNREEAELTRKSLIARGIPASDVTVLHEAPSPAVDADLLGEEGSDEVLKDVLVDGAIGTAVGTGVGAIGAVLMVAGSVTLFVASPVVAPLAMLGWFASVGGLVGAAAGANANSRTKGKFSELVMDAIKAGNTVLIARTHNETDRQLTKEIIDVSFKGRDEVAVESN